MIRGFATGAVLWVDKLFLVFFYGEAVMSFMFMVYVALVPMVLGVAMYWSRQYLFMQHSIEQIWSVIENVPAGKLHSATQGLSAPVNHSITSTLIPTALASTAILCFGPALNFPYEKEFFAVLIFPLAALKLMITTHHLEQVGKEDTATWISFGAILSCFTFLITEPAYVYAIIIAVYVVLAIVAATIRSQAFNHAPYQLWMQWTWARPCPQSSVVSWPIGGSSPGVGQRSILAPNLLWCGVSAWSF